jgi:ferredoxin
MKVWIDQDACVGNGVCAELAEDIFAFDGELAYLRVGGRVLAEPREMVAVAPGRESAVLDAAEECPVGCIYVEED